MAKVFISYRRSDSEAAAGRLRDDCARCFGKTKVFFDIHTILPGANFEKSIGDWLERVDVVIVVVGPTWLTVADASGRRRLDDPTDAVRLEVKAAIANPATRVIPVLVGGAKPINEDDLPDALKPLAKYQAVELSESRWKYDVHRVLQPIGWCRRRIIAAFATGFACIIGALVFAMLPTLPAVGDYNCWAGNESLPGCRVVKRNGDAILEFNGPRDGQRGLTDRYLGRISLSGRTIVADIQNEFRTDPSADLTVKKSRLELFRRSASEYSGTWTATDASATTFRMIKVR